MALQFPVGTETIRCPHCAGMCSFAVTAKFGVSVDIKKKTVQWVYHVAHCQTCGGCIIQKHGPGERTEIIYPKGSIRDKAPSEVRDSDESLADLYDEAVGVETFSATSAVFLLGRCAEMILIRLANVNKGDTLGPMIDQAIKSKFLEEPLSRYMKDGFRIARNQSGHLWIDKNGDAIKVDDKTVSGAFAMIDMLFDKFYIQPVKMKEWTAKVQHDEQQKT